MIANGPGATSSHAARVTALAVLFGIMSGNARSATEFFGIPPNPVVELRTQIEF